MTFIVIIFSLIWADDNVNWEDPNLKFNGSQDSKLEAQIFTQKVPQPLEKLPKQPKIKDLDLQELDSKKNK